jgi:ABC-type glycerol-3-phosphate transport system permease component
MKKQKTNWVLTIVLILGTLTVFFPLYMAVIIAFKKPSEMTNDVAGALSFPSKWSFSNFTEAMKVTDFWHSLGNSLLITIVTIVLAILIHSIAGYVIGRGMARKKSFRFIYLYIVSGMFVPFSILMMPLVKQTAQMGLGNRAGVIILYLVFYMPMNVLLYSGYLKNIPMALEEAADIDGASTWTTYWRVVFPMMKPMHATVAILTALGTWNDVMTPLVIMSGTGVLYNKDMFAENGWKVPTTWSEFTALCDEIKESGTLPLYLGFKDTWTCLAPWNALAVGLCDSDTCNQVNMGNTTFEEAYSPVADKIRTLLDYAEDNPYAYSYNDACTAFARGESAMYTIGSYAIPQIKSVNPDMNIGSFTFPANDNEADNVLNSGIDLQFSVMKACKNKEAAYEVLEYLYSDETIQTYLDDQGGIACKDGDFAIPDTLKDMQEYIKDNRMSDYQDHHYPSEMSVDAMIQTYLLDTGDNAKEKFLKKFDSDWKRYNRDLIREVQDYQKEQEDAK